MQPGTAVTMSACSAEDADVSIELANIPDRLCVWRQAAKRGDDLALTQS